MNFRRFGWPWQSKKEITTGSKNGLRIVTVAEALDAMAANNIPVSIGSLTKPLYGQSPSYAPIIGSACALGQCAINLGVNPQTLETAFSRIRLKDGKTLSSTIISLNDTFKVSPDKAAKTARSFLTAEQLEETIQVYTEFSIVRVIAS